MGVPVETAGEPLTPRQPLRPEALAWLRFFNPNRAAMPPGKHPAERAQDGPLAPTVRTTAAFNGSHSFDEPSDQGKEQIEAQSIARYTTHHVASFDVIPAACLSV
jgi:hypothetical protein